MLGPDHYHTLITRHDLAHWHGESGNLAGAVAGLEEMLADQLRLLGQRHPHRSTHAGVSPTGRNDCEGPASSER